MAFSLFVSVPRDGSLTVGEVYRRRDLHQRFGGSRFKGIVAARSENVVLLFHTEEPSQQFYRDGYDSEGIYWYSGEGTVGDMSWTAANRAIRTADDGCRDLMLFERFQRKDGLWKFTGYMGCIGFKIEKRPDRSKSLRDAIIFGLIPFASREISNCEEMEPNCDLDTLRLRVMDKQFEETPPTRERRQRVYHRCTAVRQYVLVRASGRCEACGEDAPFLDSKNRPFLESHHIDRLSDDGPDQVDRVCGICPNCHRRCHHGIDAKEYNNRLRKIVSERELEFSKRFEQVAPS